MLLTSRSIFSDNTVLTDSSVALNNFQTGSLVLPFVAAEDFFYIGSDWPFNHRYIDVGVVNANAAALTVDIWDGDSWNGAVDVIDQTAIAGVPLAVSGHISWRPDEDEPGWARETTFRPGGGDEIEGLEGVRIADLYWARLKWSADLTASTELNFLGHRFSDDADLALHYPILLETTALDQFDTGKIDWNDQHIEAARTIIRDLKGKNIVRSGSQILEWELFAEPSLHRVAEIAFKAYGNDFIENRKDALADYEKTLNKAVKYGLIDLNKNANLEQGERRFRQGFLHR